MEIGLLKKEIIGQGGSAITESVTVRKYEIMDGEPENNEEIPIRVYLSSADLCPSYSDVGNRFSVKWFVNLVIID